MNAKSVITLDILSALDAKSLEAYMQSHEDEVLEALKKLLPGCVGFEWGDAEEC